MNRRRRRVGPRDRRRGQRIIVGALAFALVVPLALEFLRIVLTGAGSGRVVGAMVGVAIGVGFVAAAVGVVVVIRHRAEDP